MSSAISMAVPVETVERDLKHLLERLRLGEAVTIVGSEGTPVAVLVSLKPAPESTELASDWEARWDALAHKVSQAWKSDESAVGTLTEMRR